MMASALFRFYEELNDFLPPAKRKRNIALTFPPPAPVKHLIETLGVPHTEVELILINGESVGLDCMVADGDQISVYPMFESLDISPLLKIRSQPLREPCFIADAHLGKLSRYLRMLGFDTLFANDLGDQSIAKISSEEGRILLTSDRALLMHRVVTHGIYVRKGTPLQQLAYLVCRLDLKRGICPFKRCMRCNGELNAVEKSVIEDSLQTNTRRVFNEFRQCQACGQIYWKGSHYQRMQQIIEGLHSN